jgi:protein tyrosine phosphatase (PTP) superfamily phosphohydrolase (DUF442 family)
MEDLDTITNFSRPTSEIYTGGQPTPDEITALGKAGFQIVINLAMANSPNALPDEQQLVQEAGMAYVHIPVEWEAPAKEDLLKFISFFQQYHAFKIFTHCVLNMRVSVFIFLYRVIVEKAPAEACWPAVLKIWQPNEVWQQFIEKMLHDVTPPSGDLGWQFDWNNSTSDGDVP